MIRSAMSPRTSDGCLSDLNLLARQPVSTGIWIALAWCLGILIIAYALAMVTYRRKIA